VNVAVVDVGSNTVRLLVGRRKRGGIEEVAAERIRVALGADVERFGHVSEARLRSAAKAVKKLCSAARSEGAEEVDVVITSPGRQADNADELVEVLRRAAAAPVRVLSAEEEASLSHRGAVAATGPHEGLVAVCDVGGASTELVLGLPERTPSWVRSVDLGALRLTTRYELGEKPAADTVEAARAEVARVFAEVVPPLPRAALAVGGSARAVHKLVDSPELGAEELERAVELLATKSHRTLTRRHGIDARRLRLLLAGALILAEVQRRLILPFEVADAGLREGALLSQLDAMAA
jgi:exopolyphosphatase/guanosine-5'-triphosphate,3'-diphosphate pyrophosphatase